MPVERLPAPTAGQNTDSAPDAVKANQAASLLNFLPSRDGKVRVRGPIRNGTFTQVFDELKSPQTFWAFDDTVLMKVAVSSSTKYYKVALSTQTMTDVTASLAKKPYGSTSTAGQVYVHARYGASVYGPIDDAAGFGLGEWDGNTTIGLQTNAPYNFTDLQVYAQRLFVLDGTVPGTTTPTKTRVLYYSDPSSTADLSLTASWQDDVSGLTNQIALDMDDTPVALAGCGRFMAILGSRSINVLTGSGSSSFAVRNLTRNLGCVSRASVVEVDDGFYFMSDRGYYFCDGATVASVSDGVVNDLASPHPGSWNAAAMNDGWIALANSTTPSAWLVHLATRAWTQVSWFGTPGAAFRSLSYPLLYSSGYLVLADWVTDPTRYGAEEAGMDDIAGTDVVTGVEWRTRTARLSGPTNASTIKRVVMDYTLQVGGSNPAATHSFKVVVADSTGTPIGSTVTAPAQASDENTHRQRLQFDVYGESDSVYVSVTLDPFATPVVLAYAEVHDIWIEFDPGPQTAGF